MKFPKPMFAPHTSLVERVWYFALRGLAVLTLLYLVLPVLAIVPLSFSSSTFLVYPIPSFSLRWYQNLIASDEWRMAAKNSFIVAPAATVVATVLGTLAAIGLSRGPDVYLTNVLPWRPPQNSGTLTAEIAMMRPFLQRHVELAKPDVLVLMGNASCEAVLGRRGITRLRGNWEQAWGKPVMPMLHPDDLLRQPQQKRQAWADLLELKAKLSLLN